MSNHAIIGNNSLASRYRAYLESTGDTVIDFMNPDLDDIPDFDLGFICSDQNVNEAIGLLGPKCKVLVTPKLKTSAHWLAMHYKYPSCQFVMAKPDLYRPQVQLLKEIRLLRDDIYDIEIYWDNIIGLIHIAHMVAGPLSLPHIDKDTMTFDNFGIRTMCEESKSNEVRINYLDSSSTTHSFTTDSELGCHGMIQNLFKLTKFNPGEYEKHFVLDRFVHLLLE